jgi:hypothetical protein
VVVVTAVGSSFLVGRTYTTGYRTLLAPGFLTDVGALSRLVAPGRDGVQTSTVDGRPLTLVCRTEHLGSSDVDEHGRPVVLVYGFACTTPLDEVAPADLERARAEALAAYRRATTRDDTTHESSSPFTLSSVPAPAVASSPHSPRRRYRLMAVATVAAVALAAGGWALFRASAVGSWTGTWRSTDLTVQLDCLFRCTTAKATQPSGCHYDLTYQTGSRTSLTFQAAVLSGNSCLTPGTVTLSRTDDSPAELKWHAGENVILDTRLSRTTN